MYTLFWKGEYMYVDNLQWVFLCWNKQYWWFLQHFMLFCEIATWLWIVRLHGLPLSFFADITQGHFNKMMRIDFTAKDEVVLQVFVYTYMEYSLIDSLPSGTLLSNLLKACYHHIFNDSGNPCLSHKMQVKKIFGCGLLPSGGRSNGCTCSITKKQGLTFQNLWNVSSSCIEFSLQTHRLLLFFC